jgi:hypothetical protein
MQLVIEARFKFPYVLSLATSELHGVSGFMHSCVLVFEEFLFSQDTKHWSLSGGGTLTCPVLGAEYCLHGSSSIATYNAN